MHSRPENIRLRVTKVSIVAQMMERKYKKLTTQLAKEVSGYENPWDHGILLGRVGGWRLEPVASVKEALIPKGICGPRAPPNQAIDLFGRGADERAADSIHITRRRAGQSVRTGPSWDEIL